jgi:hypothetical protein
MDKKRSTINYQLFNKVLLFTVDMYIDKMRQEGVELPEILNKLKIAIVSYKAHNKFTKEEADFILKCKDDEKLQSIVNVEISHIIFILTLIKLWVELVPKKERPILNISDKKLIKGKAEYAILMLKLKYSDEKAYKEKKAIIDKSVDTAEAFMDYHLNLLKEDK